MQYIMFAAWFSESSTFICLLLFFFDLYFNNAVCLFSFPYIHFCLLLKDLKIFITLKSSKNPIINYSKTSHSQQYTKKKKNSFQLFKALRLFYKKKKKNTMYTFHHQFSTPTHSKMSKFLVSKCSQRLTVHIYKSFCATIYTPSNTTLSG